MPWAPAWGSHSKSLALAPLVSPQRRQHWDPWSTGGTAEEQQFLEDGRSPSPSLFSSAQSLQCDGQPCARMCLHTVGMTQFYPANISEHWHNDIPPPLEPQWENSNLTYRKLVHGMFPELYVFIRKLLSAVINASRALVFCTSGGKTVAVNRLPVWSFLPWVLQQQMV